MAFDILSVINFIGKAASYNAPIKITKIAEYFSANANGLLIARVLRRVMI